MIHYLLIVHLPCELMLALKCFWITFTKTIIEICLSFLGLHRREIIVYSICTGLVSLILFVCTFLLRRYKQRGTNRRPFLHGTTPEQPINVIDIREQATGTSTEVGQGIYESIDESRMISDLQISMHFRNESNSSSGSSSDDNSDPLPTDGYLNPYQPMTQEFERHGYSSIVDKSDSDGSSSETDLRVSGYLNPYQLIVPDQEKHDYLQVNEDSCLENNDLSDFSNRSPIARYIDAHSYTTSNEHLGPDENKNRCEKLISSVYEDSLDIYKKVKAPMCVHNEMSHDEDQQICDRELKLSNDEHADSSIYLEKVSHFHEARGTVNTL